MILSSRLIGSEDGDGCSCAHPDDATTIAHTKSQLHDREFLNRVLDSNSDAFDSNSTMARTSKTFGSARNCRTKGPTEAWRLLESKISDERLFVWTIRLSRKALYVVFKYC